jgi:hypothetical protein
MSDGMPPGGWPMRMALYTLQLEKWADTARRYHALEPHEPEEMLRRDRGFLWIELVLRANRGEIVFRGAVVGDRNPAPINPGMLRGAVPDFAGDSIQAGGTTFYLVTVVSAEVAHIAPSDPAAAGPASRGSVTRAPEHGDDFIQEMLRFALVEDCPTRKVLSDHMKSWCLDARGDQVPTDRTIERWVQRYWPPTLPTK